LINGCKVDPGSGPFLGLFPNFPEIQLGKETHFLSERFTVKLSLSENVTKS